MGAAALPLGVIDSLSPLTFKKLTIGPIERYQEKVPLSLVIPIEGPKG